MAPQTEIENKQQQDADWEIATYDPDRVAARPDINDLAGGPATSPGASPAGYREFQHQDPDFTADEE
jgi:hypothetical protein